MKGQRIFLAVVALLLVLLSAGCSGPEVKDSAPEIPTLKLGYIMSDHHTPLFTALTRWQKFRDKYNLYLQPVQEREWYDFYAGGQKVARVKLVSTQQGPEVQRLMSQGSVDMGITGAQALILSVDQGLDAKIISPLQTGGNLLVVKKDLPVKSWPEFVALVKGKKQQIKIGHPGSQTIASVIFRSALKTEGISFSDNPQDRQVDITFVDMKGHGNLATALANHLVDGFIGAEPFPTLAVQDGEAQKITSLETLPPAGRWQNHACCTVVATEAVISKHRDLVKKLEELLILATHEVNQNRDEAAKDAAAWLGVSEKIEKEALQSVNFTTDPTGAWRQSVGTFGQIMDDMGQLTGRLHGLKPEEIEARVLDGDIYNEAIKELKKEQGFWK
ncbi:ABC transporter substrate-binding protein [Neomoorella humiferrea]|uniref:ABC transporter substrate-binding protein n=1 Tax=Neomoorella humiferrea TaxID=676965 RepID=UPI003D8BB333